LPQQPDARTTIGHRSAGRLREGNVEEAMGLLDIAATAESRRATPQTAMFIAGNLGLANLFSGRITAARQAFQQQLQLCLEHTFRFGTDEGLAGLAAIEAQDAHYGRAAMLLGASHAMGYPPVFDQPIHDRLERDFYARAKAHDGAQAWSHAERAGAALSHDQAIELALSTSRDHEYPAAIPQAVTADLSAPAARISPSVR
jgi:hypothetical protein